MAGPGTLLIGADMDALPIEERTGLPFASERRGLMHACGHDIHTVTLLGAAAVLETLAPALAGRIKPVFQPAGEILKGAPMSRATRLRRECADCSRGLRLGYDCAASSLARARYRC